MRITFAWEIGAGRGHAGPLMALATHLVDRGHHVTAFLREPEAAAGLPGVRNVRIFPSPRWIGPIQQAEGLNYGEILVNFGFHSTESLAKLVQAWRLRIAKSDLLVSNVAPAALLAAQTLELPALEISQGYHVPPPGLPSPPFRDWEPAPRTRLIESDRIVLQAINEILRQYGGTPINSLGDLFVGRTLLQTYPELEMYPERGQSEYFGVVPAKGRPMLEWPQGRPRILAYLYPYYEYLETLVEAISQLAGAAIVVCLGPIDDLRRTHESKSLVFTDRLLDFPQMASQADVVICHGSHQATAEALLASKPMLLLPTQVEQFLTARRVVKQGAALGIMPAVSNPDFSTALRTLLRETSFAAHALEFSKRYSAHRADVALDTLATRCEAAQLSRPHTVQALRLHVLAPFDNLFGCASLRALALCDLLRREADVTLWSIDAPPQQNAETSVHRVDATRAKFPSGGTLVVVGMHAPLGDWLRRAWFDRCILIYDQLISPPMVHNDIESFSAISLRVDIVYGTEHLAKTIGVPGSVQPVPIDTQLYSPVPRSAPPCTVGCGISASPENSIREHTHLFRRLIERDMRVRVIMQAAPSGQIKGTKGVEFLSPGTQSLVDILQSLDVFMLRTSDTYQRNECELVAAMSCALPVVCDSKADAAIWIEHDRNGLLFATDEEAEALIVRLRDDPGLRSRLGQEARETVKDMLSVATRRRVADFYLKALPDSSG